MTQVHGGPRMLVPLMVAMHSRRGLDVHFAPRLVNSGMKPNTTAIERAFELAQTGGLTNVTMLKRKLVSEGYSLDQITGRTLVGQLRGIMKEQSSDSSRD